MFSETNRVLACAIPTGVPRDGADLLPGETNQLLPIGILGGERLRLRLIGQGRQIANRQRVGIVGACANFLFPSLAPLDGCLIILAA